MTLTRTQQSAASGTPEEPPSPRKPVPELTAEEYETFLDTCRCFYGERVCTILNHKGEAAAKEYLQNTFSHATDAHPSEQIDRVILDAIKHDVYRDFQHMIEVGRASM